MLGFYIANSSLMGFLTLFAFVFNHFFVQRTFQFSLMVALVGTFSIRGVGQGILYPLFYLIWRWAEEVHNHMLSNDIQKGNSTRPWRPNGLPIPFLYANDMLLFCRACS